MDGGNGDCQAPLAGAHCPGLDPLADVTWAAGCSSDGQIRKLWSFLLFHPIHCPFSIEFFSQSVENCGFHKLICTTNAALKSSLFFVTMQFFYPRVSSHEIKVAFGCRISPVPYAPVGLESPAGKRGSVAS